MDNHLDQIKTKIFEKCELKISNFQFDRESKEYNACRFDLNGLTIISRNAKITPKKVGQFVTFWKRVGKGPIVPFEENDPFDFFTVNVRSGTKFGQFVFPKSVLIKKGIITTGKKEGKRAFRVYPSWEIADNKQAQRIQEWQLNYFYEIHESTDLKKVVELYKTE